MTTPLLIPVAQGNPLQTLRVTLDGTDYLLTFDWNEREGRWYMTIADINGATLVGDIKLLANWPLTRRFHSWRGPPGDLFAVDYSPQAGEPPGFADLGARVQMVYFPVTQ